MVLTTAGEDFAQLTDSFRPELLAYCYRMLGSLQDAEDQVQETLLRAWRSAEDFQGRSSVRTWLYRIATNACLRAIENRERRPLPSGLGGPADDPQAPTVPAPEVPWLQPIPDALFASAGSDPAATVTTRESMRLALIAALQYLPARQRAVLVLRDVLQWRAAEVAALLDTTPVAINSTLQRARKQLDQVAPAEEEIHEPTDPRHLDLVNRYATAFQNADIPALMQLLRSDAVLEMPPTRTWFAGRGPVAGFLAARVLSRPGDFRMVRTAANGQSAFGDYLLGRDGIHHAFGVQVLTVTAAGIARINAFNDPGLIARFGLPADLAQR